MTGYELHARLCLPLTRQNQLQNGSSIKSNKGKVQGRGGYVHESQDVGRQE